MQLLIQNFKLLFSEGNRIKFSKNILLLLVSEWIDTYEHKDASRHHVFQLNLVKIVDRV